MTPKQRSGSSKRALLHYHNFHFQNIFKSLLIISACYFNVSPVHAQGFDHVILREMSENRSPGKTRFMQSISNSTTRVSLGMPAILLGAGLIAHDPKLSNKALYMFESVGLSTLFTFAMKYGVQRDRPFNSDALIIKAGSGNGPSFPSGHTSEAFSMATSMTLAFPKWYVAVPSFIWAGTVGYSRMYLGVHYPSDVAAGAVIGIASAWLMHKANLRLQRVHKNKKLVQF